MDAYAASQMCAGVSKSGSPISRWMTSLPARSSSRARARTENAVSVPSRSRLAARAGRTTLTGREDTASPAPARPVLLRYATRAASARPRTRAPSSQARVSVNSSGEWLMPFLLGTNSIAAGT